MTTNAGETEAHTISTGTVLGPHYSTQYYARCSCGWIKVSVTWDSLQGYINGHRKRPA